MRVNNLSWEITECGLRMSNWEYSQSKLRPIVQHTETLLSVNLESSQSISVLSTFTADLLSLSWESSQSIWVFSTFTADLLSFPWLYVSLLLDKDLVAKLPWKQLIKKLEDTWKIKLNCHKSSTTVANTSSQSVCCCCHHEQKQFWPWIFVWTITKRWSNSGVLYKFTYMQ